MADNVQTREDATLGLGPIFATDQIGTDHYPLSKLGFGALDTFTIVTASAGLPVHQQTGASWAVDLGANNDVTIDGSTVIKAEDAIHGDGDTGIMILGVRNDAGGTPVTADGDYQAIQFDSSGRLRVVTQGAAGGTSSVDDAAFTAATDSGTPAMGFFSTDTVDAGDVGVLAMDASRRLLVSLEVDNVGIGGGVQYAEGATAATITGTAMMMEGAADTLVVAQGTAADGLLVNLGTNNDVSVSGTVTVDLGVNNDVTVTSGSITANAGTNLNTSALALETGGNLATLAGAVSAGQYQVDIVADGAGLLTTSAFNTVLGSASLVLATQADALANTADGLQSTSLGYVFNGTTWDRLRGDLTDGVLVNLGTNNDVTITGTVTVDGSAVTQPVSGTVTANAGTNLNTSALALETGGNLATLAGAVAAGQYQVDIVADGAGLLTTAAFNTVLGSASLVLLTQADAVVNTADGLQTTSFAYVFNGTTWDRLRGDATNGVTVNLGTNNDVTVTSGSITANAGTNLDTSLLALETGGNLATVAGAVAGTEMQVDIVAALPAGTNNIGDVDVLSVVPGTAATNLGKAVDAASGATDTGVALLVVRDDALTSLTPIDGDYTQLRVNSTGALHVTGGGGGTEYVEDDAAPANPTAAALSLVRQDTPAGLTTADGDIVTQRATNFGAAFCQILDSSGSFVDTFGGGTQYTEDAAAPANPVAPALSLVRQDTPAGLTTTDGDILTQRGTNFGAAFCQIMDSAGNFIDSFGGTGGTAQGDKTAFTEGTTSMTPIGGVFNETISADPTEDQAAAVRITAKRSLHVNIRDEADNQAVVPGTNSNHLGKLEDGASTNGATGVAVFAIRDDALAAGAEVTADGDYTFFRVNNNGALWVAGDGTFTVDGSGVTQPVSGTVTANAGTNLNTSALALETGGNLATVAGAVAGTEMQVDVVAALPAGTNNIGDVDVLTFPPEVHSADFDTGAGTDTTLSFGIAVPASGGSVVVPGDATAGLKVDLGADNDVTITGTVTVDGSAVTQPVSGTVTANAGTGTFTVDGSAVTQPVSGTVTANAGTGSFTVVNGGTFAVQADSVIPGVGATNLGKAEDGAHATGDVGVMALAVRQAADVPLSGLDLDYEPLQTDASGFLKVNVKAGSAAGTEYTEGATDATITGTAILMEGAADTLLPVQGTVADGLLVNLGTNNDVTVTSGTVTVGAVTPDLMLGTDFSNVLGTASLILATQADAVVNTSDGLQTTAFGYVFNGATWDRALGDATDGTLVNLGTNNDVTVTSGTVTANAGTGTFTVDLGANNDVTGTGNVAHDAADSGNPLKVGARAVSADITALTTNDRTDLLADLTGKLITRPHAIPEVTVSGVASATGTADTSVIAAQGAGVRIYVTSISVANSSASVGTIVEIKDGTTVIWRTISPSAGGSNITFDPPLRLTANTALNMASLSAATTAYFSANGYTGV